MNLSDRILFIDARNIFTQIDRAHREWTHAQIGFIANVVRLYRGENLDFTFGGDQARAKIQEVFGAANRSKPESSSISERAKGVSKRRRRRKASGMEANNSSADCKPIW